MKKRILGSILALVMVLTCIAGCADSSASGTPASQPQAQDSAPQAAPADQAPELEPMEITVGFWSVESYLSGGASDNVLQAVQDKFNVTIVPVNVTWDDFGQKYKMWATSDSLPDVFAPDVRTSSTLREWAENGVISALPADLTPWPNLKAYMETTDWQEGTVDGELYALCRKTFNADYERIGDRVIYYRWDLAQAAGITKEPATWDEFREMIQAIIKADPENKNIAGLITPSMSYLTTVVLSNSVPNAVHDGWEQQADGTVVPAYFAGETLGAKMLPTFQLFRDMYTEGTIDHDITMSNEDIAANKFYNGQSAATLVTLQNKWIQPFEDLNGPVGDKVKALALMPAQDGNKYYGPTALAWSDLLFGSSCDSAKMERVLSILDYLCTDEAKLLMLYGFEGEDYTLDENNVLTYTDGESDPIESARKISVKHPSAGLFSNLLYWASGVRMENYTLPLTQDPFYLQTREYLYSESKQVTLPEENVLASVAARDLQSDFGGIHKDDDLAIILTGDRPVEDMWNEILEEYKADGLEDYIAQVNEQLK